MEFRPYVPRFLFGVPHSGKFSQCTNQTPARENFFPQKFPPMKISFSTKFLADNKLRKSKHIVVKAADPVTQQKID